MKLKLSCFRNSIVLLGFLFFLQANSVEALIANKSTDSSPKEEAKITLRNWGLENAYSSHISVRKAWDITRGSRSVVVAVIDTGIDPNHPDLRDNLWCKDGSHLNEQKRLVASRNAQKKNECEYGWDFVTNRANPQDNHGHGTHVAGIIGATAKTNAGAAGVALNVSIMAVRYYSQTASGAENLANTIKAINYAVDNGADIINYSGGGAEFSAAELKAIERAESKGILFVAAAGNEHRNTDIIGNKYYPGAYGLSNIISVAATNIHNKLLPSSNWGKHTVHVAAPGENIFSTLPNNKYGFLTGTSQGTAFVSGLGALILAQNPKLDPSQVRKVITDTVDKFDSLKAMISSGGRINAYAAIQKVRTESENIQLAGAQMRVSKSQDTLLDQPDFNRFQQQPRVPARNN